MTTNQALLDEAKNANPARAEEIYKFSPITSPPTASPSNVEGDQVLRDQENAMIKLAELYRDQRNAQGLAEVITLSGSFMSSTQKPKLQNSVCAIAPDLAPNLTFTDVVRTLLNYFNDIPNSRQTRIDVLLDNIDWSKREKRIFLKHSLEIRLVSFQLEVSQFTAALTRIDTLLTELKKLDDKMILTEVHLLESLVYCGIGNLVKAKDKDYTTAYSYFYETFENMSSQDDPSALNALKYTFLCKVMLNPLEDVTALLSIKLALYARLREIECMRAIALAHQNRNLAELEKVLRDYEDELSSDPTIRSHLAALYDTLLE
ncbi:hypothetical protein M404DRAFT_1000755 [Pisolithus tinctorius Marx 270]|uniref:26S proteasome regulatory subunit Rpn6 N-terminal domain-containing protein n=1 Tax=Pisolithus tinctorius Marx 270 TaxID=870435 RepID=A0A0C3J589_PISTI|nr:hypothetical protein M404DRAFT_1000755 [Pisolithus tinctorius Marx 270]